MGVKIPKWEAELWSYLSISDGEHCPLYDCCRIRQRGSWCLDDNRDSMNWLTDDKPPYRGSFDLIESGTCYGEFKMIEMLAQRYLREGQVDRVPVPSELISLADKHHSVEIRLVPLQVCHGALWRLNDEWVVQLRKDDEPASRRFTIFHEAFHIMAHCNTDHMFKKRGDKLGAFNELLADFFAVCVLMPKAWVKAKWAEVHDVDEIARIFDVSKSAMRLRLRRLGLI